MEAVRGHGAKLKAIKRNAGVSINDHPAIRACFADFEMEALKLDYTVGGGANRVERGGACDLQLGPPSRASRVVLM